jgi:hypothetical protein
MDKRQVTPVRSGLHEDRLGPLLDGLAAPALFELYYDIRRYVDLPIVKASAESLAEVRDSLPLVDRMLDFDILFERLKHIDQFKWGNLGVPLSDVMPELDEIATACKERIHKVPRGIEKAEAWLTAVAKDVGIGADLEAAIYLASRGKQVVDGNELRALWTTALCSDIESGRAVRKIPKAVLDRAHDRSLSLAEAEQILRFGEELPRFFSFRDEEEEHIDQTMFRAVEWLDVAGFDPWLESLISELSGGPQSGFEHTRAGWWLFYWCRSDLALQMADRRGLSSWLWALINGPYSRRKPWQVYWHHPKTPGIREYVPLAGIIPFVWNRIRPDDMPETTMRSATQLLLQSQLPNGAWPLYVGDRKACLMATYTAVHGLALAQPHGWQAVVQKASEWLVAQQDGAGFWMISGGPTVAITVLVLDAIALARATTAVTFGRIEATVPLSGTKISEQEYTDILRRLRSVSTFMERSPATFAQHGEEETRDFFLAYLNGEYRGGATGETFNASGKTDILIRVQDRNTFIAECKLWTGAKAFGKAVDQLLGYLTWRDCKCALLVFNRNRNSAAVRAEMHATITSHAEYDRTVVNDPDGDADSQYVLVKRSEPGKEIVVTTMLFDVPSTRKSQKNQKKKR